MKPKQKQTWSLILTLIGALLLAFLLPMPKNLKVQRDWFWLNKTFGSSKLNLAVIGDSRIYRGVDCETLEALLGKPVNSANLGYSSAGLSTKYLEFVEKHLSFKPEKPIVIIGFTPSSFTPKALENKHLSSFLSKSKTEIWKGIYLHPTLNRFEPRSPKALLEIDTASYTEIYHSNGWMETNAIPSDPFKALDSYNKVFDGNTVNLEAIASCMSILAQWKSKGATLIGFRPPTTAAMEKLENEKSGFSEALIKAQFQAIGGIWVDLSNDDFETYDGSHLNPESAKKLSSIVAQQLLSNGI